MSEKLFPNEYSIENNDFKVGFLKQIFKHITKATEIKQEITSNYNSLQIKFTKIK